MDVGGPLIDGKHMVVDQTFRQHRVTAQWMGRGYEVAVWTDNAIQARCRVAGQAPPRVTDMAGIFDAAEALVKAL